MTTVVMIAVLVALFHFVYESILAPSFRLNIRYEMFKLRDELRSLKMQLGKEFDDKHFSYLQDSLNSMIANLHRIDMAAIAAAELATKSNKDLRERVEARTKTLDDCRIDQARAIRLRSLKLFCAAIGANNGAWTIFLVAPYVGVKCYGRFKRMIKSAASMSEGEFKKIAPSPDLIAA